MPDIGAGLMTVIVAVGLVVLLVAGIAVFLTKIYRRVDQGRALIINTSKTAKVAFHGAYVIPVFHRAENMDISVKTIEVDRRGKEGLICCDNIRADIKVTFFVRVNQTPEDVLRVAQSVGCERASDQQTIEELFGAKFSEALKTVGKQLDFEDLYKERSTFRDRILEAIGDDLNGYVLEDAAIDFLEQTPLSDLDPNNILDAQGIKKITELTAEQRIRTNELQNHALKEIGKNDLDTKIAVLAYERDEAEETAKQRRHIAVVEAKETADAEEIRAGELARQHVAKIEAEEQVKLRQINKLRMEQVADKNRERDVAIENERVDRERMLAVVAKEREVELERIARDKALEEEKRNIAEVVRERIAVDRTVAEQEEHINDLRVIAQADRSKKAAIIAAEADAEKQLIADIKAAEAGEAAAGFKAKQRLVEAQAELDAASKLAEAKIKIAEGVQAEEAASGLANARVKEAEASANEKQGMVDAKLAREIGAAEAEAARERLMAEASGIEAKAEAMAKFDDTTRAHEELRLHLEHDRVITFEKVKSAIAIAEAQAMAMGEAFKAANINIVGGDKSFYENFVSSVSVGQMVEGFMEHSPTAKALLDRISDRVLTPQSSDEPLASKRPRPRLGSVVDVEDPDDTNSAA